MEEKTYDAAVVGASIAGCTAAILLAREGASVALIERHNDPDAYRRSAPTSSNRAPCRPWRGLACFP